MVFAGLDLSMRKVGLAYVDEAGKLVEAEWITSEEKIKFNCVHAIKEKLWPKLYVRGPVVIAIEDLALGRMQFTGADLALAMGAVRSMLHDSHMTYVMVSPSKVKSFVLNQKFSGKKPIIEWSQQRGMFEFFPGRHSQELWGDVSDAHVLATLARAVWMDKKGRSLSEEFLPHQIHIVNNNQTGLSKREDLLFTHGKDIQPD